MKFQGEHFIQKPRTEVWAAVADPRSFVSGLPGFQRLDAIGDHEYEGAFEVSAGEVRSDFQGTLELSDLKSPASFRFSLNAMGAAGFVDGNGLVVLEDAGGGTKIHYDLDVKIRGRIAGVGERSLDESIRDLARQALQAMAGKPAAAPAAADPPALRPAEPAIPPAPAQAPLPEVLDDVGFDGPTGDESLENEPEETPSDSAEHALDVPAAAVAVATATGSGPTGRAQYASAATRGFGSELLSLEKRPWLLGAALVAYTAAVVLLTRACSG